MSENAAEFPRKDHVFRPGDSTVSIATLCLIGGLVCVGLTLAGFAVGLLLRPDPIARTGITVVPLLSGIALLGAAWALAGAPRQVVVGPLGVRVQFGNEERAFPWETIGWSTVQTGGLNMRRDLRLYDPNGRILVKLADALEDFDKMAELIAKAIVAKGDPAADRIRRSKARRQAVFIGATGVAGLGLAAAVAWISHRDQRAERLLEEAGVTGQGVVEERFLAPNGVTPRLVYRVTGADGKSATRNAELTRATWDALEVGQAVPVVYVEGELGISRLAFGEVEERDSFKSPLVGYGLPAVVAVMCLGFLAGAVMTWRGWDIVLDSKTGRFCIKRFGTGP